MNYFGERDLFRDKSVWISPEFEFKRAQFAIALLDIKE